MTNKKTSFTLLISAILLLTYSCINKQNWNADTASILKETILKKAEWAMMQEPQTITSFLCDRSSGNKHDFYSEGDYWWPNPDDPEGSYIRKDGETNPDNFIEHRTAMIRFSKIVGSLASAYLITEDATYATQAFIHINAWFTDELTKMNPNLIYAQAIKGRTTGRGIGIIDTIHLMEVAQAILCMEKASSVDKVNLIKVKEWFTDYITWLTTHPNGIDEMNEKNNHGTCWVMQVASFSKLTKNEQMLDFCKDRYKNILLKQMASDGSFPLELKRTKPYGYSLFNLDALSTICQILSTPEDNLWTYSTPTDLGIKKGIEFMYPYIKDKASWTYPQDVMYWDDWPVAQPALIFAAKAYSNIDYFNLWAELSHDTEIYEVERNLPVRNPLIWLY